MGSQAGSQRPAGCADTRVNNRQVDRAGREERPGASEHEGGFEHILRGNGVADIGNLGGWANAPDDTFEGADEAIFEAEISGEGNNRHGRESKVEGRRSKADS